MHLVVFLCIFQRVFASSTVMGTFRFADAIKSRHVMNVDMLIIGRIMESIFSPCVFVFNSYTICL